MNYNQRKSPVAGTLWDEGVAMAASSWIVRVTFLLFVSACYSFIDQKSYDRMNAHSSSVADYLRHM